jgi:succinylarginine dihydrolase
MTLTELQLDGLPGPTLFHGGLADGNLASQTNARHPSQPRAGARACLAKMRAVRSLGIAQGFLPPLVRPDLDFLRACGAPAVESAPFNLLAIACSTSYQWTANAGTVAPGSDTADGRSRLVVANLAAQHHRSIEGPGRAAQLRRFLPALEIIDPLPLHPSLGDEGAANHTRISGPRGICHLFICGAERGHERFRPRQARAASAAVARLLRLPAERVLIAEQLPGTVDAGAFHNDVVMVGAGDRLLLHRQAWADQDAVLTELQRRCGPLVVREVDDDELSLPQAIGCYLFNSQLLATSMGWVLVAPEECASGAANAVVRRLIDEGFVTRALFVPVRESMRGGGGPACLRLRVPLTDSELARVHPGIRLDDARFSELEQWVDRHYRERLTPEDLADPQLAQEAVAATTALDALLTRAQDQA